jgi:hypothetical protein
VDKRLLAIDARTILNHSLRNIPDTMKVRESTMGGFKVSACYWRMFNGSSGKSIRVNFIDDLALEYLFTQLNDFEINGDKNGVDPRLFLFPADWWVGRDKRIEMLTILHSTSFNYLIFYQNITLHITKKTHIPLYFLN